MYILLMISICVMCSEVTQEFRRGTSKLIQLLCLPNIRLQKQPIRFTLSWCGHTIICIHNLGTQCDFSKSKETYTFSQMVAFYSSRLYTYQNIILWYIYIICMYIYMYILLMISICVMCSEVTQEFRRGTSKLIQLLCLPNIRLQKQPIRFTLSWCGHTIICIHNLGTQCDFSKSKEAYTFNQMVAFYSSRLYTYQNIILWYANYLTYLK